MEQDLSPAAGRPATPPSAAPLLEVRDLTVRLGPVAAVNGISFDVRRGEFLGIVGESGSGKSVTAKAILGLLPKSADIRGSAKLEGEELIGAPAETMRRIRGNRIGLVFQDALAALDPVDVEGQVGHGGDRPQPHAQVAHLQQRSGPGSLIHASSIGLGGLSGHTLDITAQPT